MSCEEFIRVLFERFSPRAFVCGEDFRFGKGAEGTPERIKNLTRVSVEVQKLVRMNGEKVSSSLVKRLLEEGDARACGRKFWENRFF